VSLTLLAVGDVSPRHSDNGRNLAAVRDLLRSGDITFGQLEEPLSNRGDRQLYAGLGGPLWDGPPFDPDEGAEFLREHGFDVMSFAGNHTMDRSEESLFDTIDATRRAGIPLIGAGADLAAARTPVILERAGTRIGFLGYASVLPGGYAAGPGKPGVAPLRASTFYEQVDWQPGTPPKIRSFPEPADLEGLLADIEALRPRVNVLIVSVHWGVHFEPHTIAEYQYTYAHAAIDAGADAVLGHHAHILKGVEVYRGKPVIYCLNNFLLRPRGDDAEWLSPENTPSDQQKSIMVKFTLDQGRIASFAIQPIWLDHRPRPQAPAADDPRAASVLDYLRWCNEQQGLDTRISRRDGEFIVDLG
jgi:poly-gamma-glutamate capsule biosynthesis protein CapA/YwtB (metallophosphatase superfamily)